MDRDNLSAFYAENIGLVRQVAWKGYQRLVAIGAVLEFEDLVQELSITFMRAYDKFDEANGAKFSTYFMHAAYNDLNKIARRHEIERVDMGVRSMEEIDDLAGEGGSIAERIASDAMTPEEIVERDSAMREIEANLTPVAALVVRWIIDPPDFLERELQAHQAHADYARSRGVAKRNRISPARFVCDFLGRVTDIPADQLKGAYRQIRDLEVEARV